MRNQRRMYQLPSRTQSYVEGNTVRKLKVREEEETGYLREAETHSSRHRRHNLAYLAGLTLSVLTIALLLTYYISVQSAITASVKNIAALESQLNSLKQANDEAYSRAGSQMDLEEIKRIAIEELGMQYAKEGQIITYADGGGEDYVHQMAEIPQSDGR